jgi:hypothetical protein
MAANSWHGAPIAISLDWNHHPTSRSSLLSFHTMSFGRYHWLQWVHQMPQWLSKLITKTKNYAFHAHGCCSGITGHRLVAAANITLEWLVWPRCLPPCSPFSLRFPLPPHFLLLASRDCLVTQGVAILVIASIVPMASWRIVLWTPQQLATECSLSLPGASQVH